MPAKILAIVVIALMRQAFAASIPDVICAIPQVWDRGYSVTLTRLSDGTYSGLVDEVKMWGRIQRFRGFVQMNVLARSPSCELEVTTDDVTTGFDLRILESGDDHLLTVNGETVNPTESPMQCTLSSAFSSDAANLCAP